MRYHEVFQPMLFTSGDPDFASRRVYKQLFQSEITCCYRVYVIDSMDAT